MGEEIERIREMVKGNDTEKIVNECINHISLSVCTLQSTLKQSLEGLLLYKDL